MMDACLDVWLRPDPEMSAPLLMNSLFAKLHRQLVALKPLQIGMSFPGYSNDPPNLGEAMRLHGRPADLQQLMTHDWLGGLRGYLRIADVVPVSGTHHVRVRRVQTKSSPERLARRYRTRHGVSMDEAAARYFSAKPEWSGLPFLTVKSRSSDQKFRLFISQEQVEGLIPGEFNCYALSGQASLAWP